MADRITGIIKNETLIRNLNKHQLEFNRLQTQLSTGKKINKSSDNPSAATHQLYLGSRLKEIDQFNENLGVAQSRLRLIDGRLQTVTSHLQRIRELTVQAGHGIYQGDNAFALKQAIAREVDEHLRALVDIANSSDETGRALFGGYLIESDPYQKLDANTIIAPTDGGARITNVVYRGDRGPRQTEIERGQYLNPHLSGAEAFWATNMIITSSIDSSAYTAASPQQIRVDGKTIAIATGDTQALIVDKINAAQLEVQADIVDNNQIVLATSQPHQILLEDVANGTVLQDLGLINNNENLANNYAATATVTGLSLFGMIITLRDDLENGNQIDIGGRDLAFLDGALNNILRHHTSVGAKQKRLEEHEKNLAWDKVFFTELYAQNEAIDFPEAITNLRWLETVHQYALNVGARIIQPQLLNFLR